MARYSTGGFKSALERGLFQALIQVTPANSAKLAPFKWSHFKCGVEVTPVSWVTLALEDLNKHQKGVSQHKLYAEHYKNASLIHENDKRST